MTPDTGSALLIILVFVLPGFATLVLMQWTYQRRLRDRTPLELVLVSLLYSSITYLAVGIAVWPFGVQFSDVARHAPPSSR